MASERYHAAQAAAQFVSVLIAGAIIFSEPLPSIPYHTSALSGQAWVVELINGHPERMRTELGVRVHVFRRLVLALQEAGMSPSKHISLEEKLAIFLYASVTGLSIRHLGERFQHSNETISRYFQEALFTLSSAPFYTRYVFLPSSTTPIPPEIRDNSKFFPFFAGALGAIDGTHIKCCPSVQERQSSRNRKGGVSQNCLACCSFDLHFQYVLSGWDGSAADAAVYNDARQTDLTIPADKFYLADAGFGACDGLLVPFRGVRYHLAEWGRASVRPANREELYNLRHSSARNAIERIFGILKRRFTILDRPPEYTMTIQARIPPALAAVHNFIRIHDQDEILEFEDVLGGGEDAVGDYGELAEGPPSRAEKTRAEVKRDHIAQAMWEDYQQLVIGGMYNIDD